MTAQSAPAPPITIVIPVWGSYVERYLEEALQSIEAQSIDASVVLVDNGTEPPFQRDGVTIVRSEFRRPLGAARNLGLGAVQTPLVMLWDADDVMPEGSLARMLRRLAATPAAVACAPGIIESPDGYRHHWPRPALLRLTRAPRLFATVNAVSSLYPVIGAAVRTEVARATAFPPVDHGDDWAMGVSLAFRGRIVAEPHPGRIYRRHPDSLSASWTRRDAVAHARLVRRRLHDDAAVPRALRALAPLVALAQHLVIWVLAPAARRYRGAG